MSKRILITGINGFVGSHLLDYLLEHTKDEIFGLVRVNARLDRIEHNLDKITLLYGDLLDQTSLLYVLEKSRPDVIYHLGALSWVSPSWTQPAIYMQTNAIGTINLFESIRTLKLDPRILLSATPEEFGNVEDKDLPITEETKMNPINPYAVSKAAQDMIAETYFASYGMKIIRTRGFNHEGPRRDVHGANASFAYQIAKIEKGLQEPLIKVGNLDALRNFTDVRDMARGYFLCLEKGIPGELYLIGTDRLYTMKETLEKLISLSTKKDIIKYEIDPERVRPTELLNFTAKFDKLKALCNWEPEYSFDEMMQSVIDYWRNQVKG